MFNLMFYLNPKIDPNQWYDDEYRKYNAQGLVTNQHKHVAKTFDLTTKARIIKVTSITDDI